MPPPDTEARRRAMPIEPRPGLFEQGREAAFRRLDQQKDRAATGLTSFVDALRQSGRQLEGENATVASYVDAAAGQVERFIGGLRDRDMSEMVEDLERFGRRRPGVFLGSAFVIGLVAARFLKSSPRDRERVSPRVRESYPPRVPESRPYEREPMPYGREPLP